MTLVALHGHRLLIAGLAVSYAVLALWAFLAHVRGRRSMPAAFWTVLLIVVAVVTLEIAAGVLLTLMGGRPRVGLHFLYGVVVTGLAIYQVGLRPGGFVGPRALWLGRDPHSPSVLALLCLTQAALIVRAFQTGAFGR